MDFIEFLANFIFFSVCSFICYDLWTVGRRNLALARLYDAKAEAIKKQDP